jgi:hypothetical protein
VTTRGWVVAIHRRRSTDLVRVWADAAAAVGRERVVMLRTRATCRSSAVLNLVPLARNFYERPPALLGQAAAGDPGHEHGELPQPALPPPSDLPDTSTTRPSRASPSRRSLPCGAWPPRLRDR